jgi:predicted MFS family arabinose efflux permease
VVAALGAGAVGFEALPFVVGSLVDGLGLDETRAGWIASLELAAMALSALVLAPRVAGLSLRTLALSGAALAASAHAASALADGFVPLLALRVAGGLGEGALVAAGNALIASSIDPDRLAARVEIAMGLAAAALLAALPRALAVGAHRAAFAAMLLVVLACAPLLTRIPHAPASARPAKLAGLAQPRAVAILAGGLLLTAGESAIWAFVERLGRDAGLEAASMGLLLGASTLVGLLGAGLAVWLGARRGRSWPIALGIAVQAAGCWSLVHAQDSAVYVAGVLAYAVSFFFVQPYLIGTAAAADSRGRVAAAFGGVVLLGGGIGPGLAGTLIGWSSYAALAWQVVGASAAALAAILPVAAALDREAG